MSGLNFRIYYWWWGSLYSQPHVMSLPLWALIPGFPNQQNSPVVYLHFSLSLFFPRWLPRTDIWNVCLPTCLQSSLIPILFLSPFSFLVSFPPSVYDFSSWCGLLLAISEWVSVTGEVWEWWWVAGCKFGGETERKRKRETGTQADHIDGCLMCARSYAAVRLEVCRHPWTFTPSLTLYHLMRG